MSEAIFVSIPKSIVDSLGLNTTDTENDKPSLWQQNIEKVMANLSDDDIRRIFLANDFKTRLQADFTEDLNPYCYTAGRELVKYVLENMSKLSNDNNTGD